ncbi:MAG: 3-methyl-2-oxobutanoate dehydrogenase subunit beta, partial [Oscillospiraceae bacterium]|nr:3-methyl-2-oxobutanoate dehydrogenase subunit beta [Oscillospiraceae bacterium]
RVPVLMLADGIMAQMMEPVEMPEMVDYKVDPEKKPWACTGWQPGDDPAKRGVINSLYINTEELALHNDDLQATYREIEKNEIMYETYLTEDADIVITAFGTVARIAKSAIHDLREQGIKVGLFRPITVWPFPYNELAESVKGAKAILDVEVNEGQMMEDVRLAVNGTLPVHYFGHCGSQMPTTDEIKNKILEMKEGI